MMVMLVVEVVIGDDRNYDSDDGGEEGFIINCDICIQSN
jgi:hypothetical protein